MSDWQEIFASEYALGISSDADIARAEALMAQDEKFADLVAWWIDCFSPLLGACDEIDPPSDLFAKIEKQIDRQTAMGGGASVTVRESEGRWVEIAPGARRKHLYFDKKSCSEAFLIELDAGATLPAHDHNDTEDCLVIAGDFAIGDLRLTAGDFHAAFSASRHAPCRSENGCRLFIKAAA